MSEDKDFTMQQYRTCPRCKQSKSLEDYARNKQNTNGLQSYCKLCQKEIRELNAEANKHYAQWYRRANHKALLEQKRIAGKLYYEANKEKILARGKTNYKVESSIAKGLIRRARLAKNKTSLISKKEIMQLRAQDCFYCKKSGGIIDHIIPIARGGSHSIGNLLPACKSCNASKGAKTIMEWKKVRGW